MKHNLSGDIVCWSVEEAIELTEEEVEKLKLEHNKCMQILSKSLSNN